MKQVLLFLLLAAPLSAQWIVNDPVNTAVNSAIQADQAANQVEILRQWTADLEKLNQQLEQMRAQLDVQQRIRQIMGDPAAAGDQVRVDGLGAEDLTRTFGETADALRDLARAVVSLKYTAQGIYEELDDATVLGRPFTRQPAPYQRYGVVEKHADNLASVFEQTAPRLADLQRDLADTLRQLKAAPTQAEVDKQHAKISVLVGQIGAVEAQRRDAALQLQAQQILNENQAAKERQDLLEKQIAEEGQTFAAVGAWQESLKITPTSYTQP
jgi:hypothetical protein